MKIMFLLLLLSIVIFLYSIQNLIMYGGSDSDAKSDKILTKRSNDDYKITAKRRKLSIGSDDDDSMFDDDSDSYDDDHDDDDFLVPEKKSSDDDSDSYDDDHDDDEKQSSDDDDSLFASDHDDSLFANNDNDDDDEVIDYSSFFYDNDDDDEVIDYSNYDWLQVFEEIKTSLNDDDDDDDDDDDEYETEDEESKEYSFDYQEGTDIKSTTILKANLIDESYYTIDEWAMKPIVSNLCYNTVLVEEDRTNVAESKINFYFTDKVIECWDIDDFKRVLAMSHRTIYNGDLGRGTLETSLIYYKLKLSSGNKFVELSEELINLLNGNGNSKKNNFYLKLNKRETISNNNIYRIIKLKI